MKGKWKEGVALKEGKKIPPPTKAHL